MHKEGEGSQERQSVLFDRHTSIASVVPPAMNCFSKLNITRSVYISYVSSIISSSCNDHHDIRPSGDSSCLKTLLMLPHAHLQPSKVPLCASSVGSSTGTWRSPLLELLTYLAGPLELDAHCRLLFLSIPCSYGLPDARLCMRFACQRRLMAVTVEGG